MTAWYRRALFAALVCGLLAELSDPVAAQPLSPARQRQVLREALALYDEAVAVSRTDPTQAAEMFRRSAAGLLALRAAGVRNAALEYNLGNVYFRLGELGRAVLHYRRAEQLSPHDHRLRANLRYARQRVEPNIAPSGQSRLVRQLAFWHYQTSPRQRFWALIVLSSIGWSLLFAWLLRGYRLVAAGGLICVLLGLGSAASLLWQMVDERRHPHAVVINSEAYLRLGRGMGADLALKQALGPGVELRILRRHGEWVEVQLPSEQTGWLPADSLELVGEAAPEN